MKKYLLVASLIATFLVPVTAGTASAASPTVRTATHTSTLTYASSVRSVAKLTALEAHWSTTGCSIASPLAAVLAKAKAGAVPAQSLAASAARASIPTRASSTCTATAVIAKQIGTIWTTYYAYKRVYIKQTISGSNWWSHPSVTRWIGRDANHVTRLAYAV